MLELVGKEVDPGDPQGMASLSRQLPHGLSFEAKGMPALGFSQILGSQGLVQGHGPLVPVQDCKAELGTALIQGHLWEKTSLTFPSKKEKAFSPCISLLCRPYPLAFPGPNSWPHPSSHLSHLFYYFGANPLTCCGENERKQKGGGRRGYFR